VAISLPLPTRSKKWMTPRCPLHQVSTKLYLPLQFVCVCVLYSNSCSSSEIFEKTVVGLENCISITEEQRQKWIDSILSIQVWCCYFFAKSNLIVCCVTVQTSVQLLTLLLGHAIESNRSNSTTIKSSCSKSLQLLFGLGLCYYFRVCF
jgi:hypothetical protein